MRGRRPSNIDGCLESLRKDLTGKVSVRTLASYESNIRTMTKVLQEGGKEFLPWKIGTDDVNYLLNYFKSKDFTISTRRGYIAALRVYCEFYDNSSIRSMKLRWPKDMRRNVDWLTEEEAERLLRTPMSPIQRLIVHCELCLGMRRIEVIRLTVRSFKGSRVDILGKGAQGGKPRTMPYHRDTEAVVSEYMTYRNALITLVKQQNRNCEIPDSLLIYMKGSQLYSYAEKGSGIDEILKPLGTAIGKHFGNHTLRRSFGRFLYRWDVPVATISQMLGHDSQDTTLKYIGVNLDDMGEAIKKYRL